MALRLMIGEIALQGTVTATQASWLLETVAAKKCQAEDYGYGPVVGGQDRPTAESTRGRTADRSELDLLLVEAADHDQDQAYRQPDDHSYKTSVGHE